MEGILDIAESSVVFLSVRMVLLFVYPMQVEEKETPTNKEASLCVVFMR